MDHQHAIGAKLLERRHRDAAQHFVQLQRAGEGLQNPRQELVPLFGQRAPPAIEVRNHQPPHVRVVAPLLGQFHHAHGQLLALRLVAHALPDGASADGDEAEILAAEQVERFLLGRRHDGRETEGGGHFGRGFRDRLGGDNKYLLGHSVAKRCGVDATTKTELRQNAGHAQTELRSARAAHDHFAWAARVSVGPKTDPADAQTVRDRGVVRGRRCHRSRRSRRPRGGARRLSAAGGLHRRIDARGRDIRHL